MHPNAFFLRVEVTCRDERSVCERLECVIAKENELESCQFIDQ